MPSLLFTVKNLKILFYRACWDACTIFEISWSEIHLNLNLAGLLILTCPMLTAPGGHFITGEEELTSVRFCIITLGFMRVIVLIYEVAFQLGSTFLLAQLAVVLSSTFYAAGNLNA